MTATVRRPQSSSRPLLSTFVIALAFIAPSTGRAQYFGQNKVPYEHFHFEVLRTPHWDVHYYNEEAQAARDAARMLERWNTRLSSVMSHTLSKRKPVILYADHPDFQQTNVVSGMISEGTGGVTESLMDRMVLPMTGYYAETDHVLGHEGVHVFQYDIANTMQKGVYFERMPLWLVEGMAEYLSVGPEDAHTAMWLRDALQRNDLPTIDDLTNSSKYFPYRYGEALWAFIGGTWGDEKVVQVFRSALEFGVDQGIHSRARHAHRHAVAALARRDPPAVRPVPRWADRATRHRAHARRGQARAARIISSGLPSVPTAGSSRISTAASVASSSGWPTPPPARIAARSRRPVSPRGSTR